MNKLQQFWEPREWPNLSGVWYADGRFIPVDVTTRWHTPEGNRVTIKVGHSSKINLQAVLDLDTTELDEYGSLVVGDMRMSCGGGQDGADGYVALVGPNGELIWIFFSNESNPFMKFHGFADDIVTVVSEHRNVWHFPIYEPEKVWADPE